MPKHWIKYENLPTIELCADFLRELGKEDKALVKRLKAAYKISDQHNTDLAVRIAEGNVSCAPVAGSEDAEPMGVDEAIILAVELHHIFRNNPNVSRLSVTTSIRTIYTYMYKGFIAREPHVAVIVLNAKGEYLTSYDPKRQELFPRVSNLSAKLFKKCDLIIADTLDALTREFKSNIEKERAEEAASAESDDQL